MLKVGLIGCGSIGTVLARAIESGLVKEVVLGAVFDISREKAEKLTAILSVKPVIASDFEDFLAQPLDIVIEAASQEAVAAYAEQILQAQKDLMIMSVGALLQNGLLERLEKAAQKYGCKIYIPSGAIAGIDAIKAASLVGLDEVVITTRKPPAGLKGAPYLKEKGIDLDKIAVPTLIYEGPAEEAVRAFPANVNVAAVLSLAGIGKWQTRVRVIADPTINTNQHEIRAKGNFGELCCVTKNFPCPDNPKTSYLAALAAIKTLERIASVLRLGT